MNPKIHRVVLLFSLHCKTHMFHLEYEQEHAISLASFDNFWGVLYEKYENTTPLKIWLHGDHFILHTAQGSLCYFSIRIDFTEMKKY